MRKDVRQSGFSLLEMVVVIATILILAGALLGVGKYLMIRAEVDLTSSELEVLATALQQYYTDFGAFPFDTDINGDGYSFTDANGNGVFDSGEMPDYNRSALENAVTGLNGVVSSGTLLDEDASSAALFFFLDKNPNSRKIAEALSDSLISNKDITGTAIKITIGANPPIDLPRFIDAWGTSIRYEYLAGTAFPKLTSAGPDKVFATPDDVVK